MCVCVCVCVCVCDINFGHTTNLSETNQSATHSLLFFPLSPRFSPQQNKSFSPEKKLGTQIAVLPCSPFSVLRFAVRSCATAASFRRIGKGNHALKLRRQGKWRIDRRTRKSSAYFLGDENRSLVGFTQRTDASSHTGMQR